MPELKLTLPEPFLHRDAVAYQLALQERIDGAQVNAQINGAVVRAVLDLGWLTGLSAQDVDTTPAWQIAQIAQQAREFILVQMTPSKKT